MAEPKCDRVLKADRGQKTGSYKKEALSAAATELNRNSATEACTRQIPAILAALGVRFVVVPHLTGTKIDGATAWLNEESPVVAVSLRYDRLDWFWFTLMHELAHVLTGDAQKKALIDQALVGKDADAADISAVESRADKMAAEWLVPNSKLVPFIKRTRPYFSRNAILQFAAGLGVHPALVVGPLQKRGEVPYTHHRNLLVKARHLLASE